MSLLFAIDYLFVLLASNFSFSHLISIFPYFSFFGGLDFSWSFKLDFISGFILFLICFISSFIQIFSASYMQGDVSFTRFILYMSFFSFSILLLVSASNLLVLFAGWEIVGLASVLLINFWFNRQEANWGAFKAFSFNRVGDASLIMAFAIFFFVCSSTDFDIIEIFLFNSPSSPYSFVFFIAFLFTIFGSFAKSAQFFFHSWLPDAMEGPTPVSALLHSATIVTAGVYVSIRCFFAISYYPFFQILLCFFGLLTSFYSAFVLTTVNNSKHTTAYTTLNQLGFMFYAVGSLVFSTALFHLIIHGFYKSFTFLENAIELSNTDDEQEGSVFFLNTNFFETVYDFFGFIVFISVNALPFSSPSVSKELLVFSGFESFSNFISFLLLSTLFIGFIDSCYDDNQFEFNSSSFVGGGIFSNITISVPFPMFFSYFCLGVFSLLVVFFSEEIFLNLSFYFSDFFFFNLQTNGSFFIFLPFAVFISTSFFFPTLNAFFVSSDFSFKIFLSNIFFYDNMLVVRIINFFYTLFFMSFKFLDRGFIESAFIKLPINYFVFLCSMLKFNSFFANFIWVIIIFSIFFIFLYLLMSKNVSIFLKLYWFYLFYPSGPKPKLFQTERFKIYSFSFFSFSPFLSLILLSRISLFSSFNFTLSEKYQLTGSNIFRKFFFNQTKVNKIFYFSTYFFMQKEFPSYLRIFTLIFSFLYSLLFVPLLITKCFFLLIFFFFEISLFTFVFIFNKYFFKLKILIFFYSFKLNRTIYEIFLFFFIRTFTRFFFFFFSNKLSKFKSNYLKYIEKLKIFLVYYYSIISLRFSTPRYFKKLFKRFGRNKFRPKPVLDLKLRKQMFAEEAFIQAFDSGAKKSVIEIIKEQFFIKNKIKFTFSAKTLKFLVLRQLILVPALFIRFYLEMFSKFFRKLTFNFVFQPSNISFSKFYPRFYLDFFLDEIRFFYYLKNYFSFFQLLGIYFSDAQKISQLNYFKMFLTSLTISSSHSFFEYFKSKNLFFKNDLLFYVFSQPYVFNFFFPVFSNVFIDALIQDAIIYRDDTFYKVYSSHLSDTYYQNRSKTRFEGSSESDDLYEYEDEDNDDEEEVDDEFISGRVQRHAELLNSNIEEDFEAQEQPLAKPFIKYVVKHHSKNVKRMFSSYSEPSFSDYLDLYDEFNREYNIEPIGYPDSVEYISYLSHSDLGYYRDSDLHEFFYQYYFSRFYGSTQIDMFFYSFVFPYAFKNFSFSYHLSKFFKAFFFDSVNYTYNNYFSFFYLTPIISLFKLYFKISFFDHQLNNSYSSTNSSIFSFFKYFHFRRLLFVLKNLFYGYFYFLKTTSVQRDLDFQTTYNRLYDLKQHTQIDEVGEIHPTYDLNTVEDEDHDPDYINYYFFENFQDDYETLFFEDDDFFNEDTENEQFYHNYVFSDDFIQPFLTDDEFQESIEYSISIDDTFYNSSSYAINEQFEFELNEMTLAELIAQNVHINFLNNFLFDVLFSNTKYFNHADPVLDVDFALDYDVEEIKSDYYDKFTNPPQLEQSDAFSLPNDKKSLIIIKNLSELYNDRLTKWLVKNKNFNLKPLPPFLFGIGRYIPSSNSNGFLKLSDLHKAFSKNSKNSNLDFFSTLAFSNNFKPYYDTQKFDKNFLRNFFLFFSSPVHLFPKDSYLSTVIAFHLLTKSFSFNHFEFLSLEIQEQSRRFFFDGLVAHLIYSEELKFGALFETSSHFVPDQDFETQIFIHMRTLRPTTLIYLREKYISIIELNSDSDGNFIGDSDSYHAQWGFFPSYTSSPTNYFFYHLNKIAPALLHNASDLPNSSLAFFPFFKRYKVKEDKFPKTKWARKFYKEPKLKDYPKFRLPFVKLKYKQLDDFRIKRKARYINKWYKFFKLDITEIYPDISPKAVSFFSFIYLIDYSLFFAFNHLKDDFFFLYSLVQTSITKQYRINPLVYQNYRLRPNSTKNTYFLFDTYYGNYLLHLDKKVKARQIQNFRASSTLLNRFGFDPDLTYQTIENKRRQLSEKRKRLRKKNKERIQTSFRYSYYFNITGSEDLDDSIQHANVSLLYEKRNYWSSRLKLDNSSPDYTFHHQHYSPENSQFFDLSIIDFFYANENNPFSSFFFKFNSFSIFKAFDFYLQPYQYTFPIGNYYFDSFFYPEEEINTDFNIFDFYIIDEAEELDDARIDPAEYEEYLPTEFRDIDFHLTRDPTFTSDEAIDGTSDIQTSEYHMEDYADTYLPRPEDAESGYEPDPDGEATFATDLIGFADLPEYDPNNDIEFDLTDNYDHNIGFFIEDLDNTPDHEDLSLYDHLYDDNYQNIDFSELDFEEEQGLNYLQETFIFDRRFIDPFLTNYFNKYDMNPKNAYPASTFIHFRSRPLRDNEDEDVKRLLNRKLYILRNVKNPEDRKRFAPALKFPKKYRRTIKFRNTKYYLRYLHFSKLLNSNKPFYTSSFPLYNSFDVDFQLTSAIEDKFNIDLPSDQNEDFNLHFVDELDFQLREDFFTYLDQDNDDLDPDFFDFASYTSVPISRFFFGYSKSNVSPFTTSDPRFVISSGSEFKFINASSFSSSFSETSTKLTTFSSESPVNNNLKKFSPFYLFFRLVCSICVKYYLSFKIFWIYHILYNKPEFQVITNFEILFFHYNSHKQAYNVTFFKKYYDFVSEWNKQLIRSSISFIRFDYFKNFFNPTYYTSNDSNFSNLFASKFAADDDSEYLHLNFFVETELYTTLLMNEKIENVLSDRIQIPVFFWNYDEYFLYLINSFDAYDYNVKFDIQDGFVNQSQQNINTNFADDPIEYSDIYEELFDNTKQLYISRIEIFFEAFGQLLFISFFGFYNFVKNIITFCKTTFTAFTLYIEAAWLSLYLRHGPIVYFFRVFLSVNLFILAILYSFFNIPYLIFYFYPFLTGFSHLLFVSITLLVTFIIMGFIIFKNFRFFLFSIDYEERIVFFVFSVFLWFYNVYLGYVFHPTFSNRFVHDDFYSAPTEIRFLLLNRRNPQMRYRRPSYFFQNENLPFPSYRPSSYTQNPYKLIYTPGYELSGQPYAFGLPPEPHQTFVKFSKNFFLNSLNNFRELPLIKTSSYTNLLKPQTPQNKRPTSTFLSSASNPIIDSFFRNRNRKMKRHRLFALTVLPFERHSFWSADYTRENRLNSETFGFPTRGFGNPLYTFSDVSSYQFSDVYSKRTSDYVYYPQTRVRKIRDTSRFIKKFYRRFKYTTSRRSIIIRFVPNMHDDPLFRKVLFKSHSYKPFKYIFVPNYERKKYLRNILLFYSRNARQGIKKIFKKEFQFDPRSKKRKRRAKGSLRHRIFLSRFENRHSNLQFVKPYAFFLSDQSWQKQKFIANYSPFSTNIYSKQRESMLFLSRNLPKPSIQSNGPSQSLSSNSKISKFTRSKNLNVNSVIDQKLSGLRFNPTTDFNTNDLNSSLANYEILRLSNAHSNFERSLPHLLYYISLERIGSTVYSKHYAYELSKRFSPKNINAQKLSNFYKFQLFPSHYKFQIFFSRTYSDTYRFFFSSSYVSRNTFLLSTLFSPSPIAETALKRLQYKRRINVFNNFFKSRYNKYYLKAAKRINSDNYVNRLLMRPILNQVVHLSENFYPGSASHTTRDTLTARKYYGLSEIALNSSLEFDPQFHKFDHPFSIYFSSFGQDWYQLFKTKTGFSFFSSTSDIPKFGYYPTRLNSQFYNPFNINIFSSIVHSDSTNVLNFEKRLRDLVSFRYAFNKFLNNRQRFISNFSSKTVLPLYSSSNYLNSILFSLYFFNSFSHQVKTNYPVLEPNFFSTLTQSSKLITDSFNPFLTIFESNEFQNSFFTPSKFTSHEFDSVFDRSSFYDFGTRSFLQFQNRLSAARYPVNFSKIFNKKVQVPFRFLQIQLIEGSFLRSIVELYGNRRARKIFESGRFKRSSLFSKAYHTGLQNRRTTILQKRRINPKYRFNISERKFLKNKLNRISSLSITSGFLSSERDFFYNSLLSFKPLPKYFFQESSISFGRNRRSRKPYTFSAFPFDIFSDVYFFNETTNFIYPNRIQSKPNQFYETPELKVRKLGKRPARRIQSFFKRRQISFNRPTKGYRSRFFLSKYFRN